MRGCSTGLARSIRGAFSPASKQARRKRGHGPVERTSAATARRWRRRRWWRWRRGRRRGADRVTSGRCGAVLRRCERLERAVDSANVVLGVERILEPDPVTVRPVRRRGGIAVEGHVREIANRQRDHRCSRPRNRQIRGQREIHRERIVSITQKSVRSATRRCEPGVAARDRQREVLPGQVRKLERHGPDAGAARLAAIGDDVAGVVAYPHRLVECHPEPVVSARHQSAGWSM